MTPQRMAILHILHQTDGHISPTEVYQRASREIPGLTEATVYRTLEFLAQNGLARSAHMGAGHFVYERTKHDHHHLICRRCNAEMQIDHASLEQVYAELEASSGFRLIDSHITFFGLCPDCQDIN